MRRIAAQYLFTGQGPLLRRGVVTLDDNERVVAVGQLSDTESCSTEFYNGILSPGFVNAHCHLELSFLFGAIAPQQGMAHFVNAMRGWSQRAVLDEEIIFTAMERAEAVMQAEGVMAVADICNTTQSFVIKAHQRIYYHSFVESVGLPDNIATERIAEAERVMSRALSQHLTASITPHAAYSMSSALFSYAVKAAGEAGILSIHNQESAGEGPDGLRRLLSMLDRSIRLLLVHNTYTSVADMNGVMDATDRAVWVLCPNSNIYITGSLPPADLLCEKQATVAIGTDSLASNTQLSVLEEIKTLSQHFPQIPLTVLLEWATLGGATALNKQQELGLILPGKKTGLVLIEGVDFNAMKLLPTAKARKL